MCEVKWVFWKRRGGGGGLNALLHDNKLLQNRKIRKSIRRNFTWTYSFIIPPVSMMCELLKEEETYDRRYVLEKVRPWPWDNMNPKQSRRDRCLELHIAYIGIKTRVNSFLHRKNVVLDEVQVMLLEADLEAKKEMTKTSFCESWCLFRERKEVRRRREWKRKRKRKAIAGCQPEKSVGALVPLGSSPTKSQKKSWCVNSKITKSPFLP